MAVIENKKTHGVSSYGLEFFERYKESFGKVTKAEMKKQSGETSRFILTNSKGEEMIFDSTFTAGYPGEGPKATQKVLNSCGFMVDDDFSFRRENETFSVKKAN